MSTEPLYLEYYNEFKVDLNTKSEITLFYTYNFNDKDNYISIVSDKINDNIFIFELSRYGLDTGTALGGYFPYLFNLIEKENGIDYIKLFYRYKYDTIDTIKPLGRIVSKDLMSYVRNIFTIDLTLINSEGDIKTKIFTNKSSAIYNKYDPSINDSNTRKVSSGIYQHSHELFKITDIRNINNTCPAEDILPGFIENYKNTISPVTGEVIYDTDLDDTNQGYFFYNNIIYKADHTNYIFPDSPDCGDYIFIKDLSNDTTKLNDIYINTYMNNCTQEIYSFKHAGDNGIMGDYIISLSGFNLNPINVPETNVNEFLDNIDWDNIYLLVYEE